MFGHLNTCAIVSSGHVHPGHCAMRVTTCLYSTCTCLSVCFSIYLRAHALRLMAGSVQAISGRSEANICEVEELDWTDLSPSSS
eukprot:scaffold5718_cov112-Skeletonema_dohrnii-CCMP3373.AAC.4